MTNETQINANATAEVIDTRSPEQIRIDALKAELAIEEEKVREQAREIKRQEQEAERQVKLAAQQVKNAALVEKIRVYAADLVAALNAEGVACSVREGNAGEWSPVLPGVKFADASLGYSFPVHFEERRTGSCYSSRSNGYKVMVGQFGETKSFPQLAKGGFSYEKIAKEVASRIQNAEASRKREILDAQKREHGKQTAAELVKVIGGSVVDYRVDRKGRYVACLPSITMSLETAQKLADRIAELEANQK
jgi:hypothetical protein